MKGKGAEEITGSRYDEKGDIPKGFFNIGRPAEQLTIL